MKTTNERLADKDFARSRREYAKESKRLLQEAAPDLAKALQICLAYMTNVNSYDATDVAQTSIAALKKAGLDEEGLDDIAIAMMSGACRMV